MRTEDIDRIKEIRKLNILDSYISENEYDNSVDVKIWLENDIQVSISWFVDEPMDSTVVFSVHRKKDLLIADTMKFEELMETLNNVQKRLLNYNSENK